MPHFFITTNDINNNEILIQNLDIYKHVVKSLRAKIGERLLLIDENRIQYETSIKDITNKAILCEIQNKHVSENDLDFDLYLAQAPLRSDAQSTIIEKATEIGVRGIYPIITDNCVVKTSIINNKIEKWNKIMTESSKQCERASIPTCYQPSTITDVLQNNFDKILVMAERSTESSLKQYFETNKINKNEKILVIIGPEGGFSHNEFEYFRKNNIPMISLGNIILKAETAVIVALGNIVYEFQ